MARREPQISRELLFEKLGYEYNSPLQESMHISEARFRVASCGRRFGKALDVTTVIPTPKGFKTMMDLEVGDEVFDEFGESCRVTNVSPIYYDHKCFKIKFNDGTEIIADAGHLWHTWDKRARKAIGDFRRHTLPDIRTTEEISKTLFTSSGENNHAIQVSRPLQFNKTELPIDPYVLGAWLGDGTTDNGEITIGDEDLELALHVEDRGYPIYKTNTLYRYNVVELKPKLRELGVLGDKYVPDEYLMASEEDRQALLEGLMDTDGSALKTGQVEFCNKNSQLAASVYWLAASLEQKPRLSHRITNGTKYYRVFFAPTRFVFRLQRKRLAQSLVKGKALQRHLRFITSVEEVESVPVKCISVDSLSKLYLATAACIPTHNSTWAGHEMTYRMFIPESIHWIVGPNYRLGEKEFRIVLFDIKKLGLTKRCSIQNNINQGNMRIHFKDLDSIVEVVSAEKPDGLVGEGLDSVIMSEAAKHKMSTWQMYIEPALSDKRGCADFPSTPQGYNWFKGIYDLGQMGIGGEAAYAEYASWNAPTWTNTKMYPGGFDDPELVRIRNTVSKQYWDQEYAAKFTSFEGMIYDEFNPDIHVRRVQYNPFWRNYWAVDFGFTDPFVCLDIMVDAEQRVYVWREYQVRGKSTSDHGLILSNRSNPEGFHVDAIFADPRGADQIMTLTAILGGINAHPVGWEAGIEAVKRSMKVRDDGLPAFTIDPSCKETIRQLQQLRKKTIREGHNERPGQHDYDDHGCDALRYFYNEFFIMGAGTSLRDVYDTHNSSEAAGFFTYTTGMTLDEGVSFFRQ